MKTTKTMTVLSLGILLWLCTALPVVAEEKRLVVVAATDSHAYQQFITAFSRKLGSGYAVKVVPDRTYRETLQHAQLIVTLGADAAADMSSYAKQTPIINALVTKAETKAWQGDQSDKNTKVVLYLEQPVFRTMALVKSALPEREQITVALGPTSKLIRDGVDASCYKLALRCDVLLVEDEEGIEEALGHAERDGRVLVVFPDPRVVNAVTAKNLILGAYRRGVALVGYSRALVKAGALMAVYSTPSQLGEDAARQARELMAKRVPEVRPMRSEYPINYSVSVNYQLARALRLNLEAEMVLLNAVHKAERND